MKTVINYGHGPKNVGYDPGAIGPTGYQEATQNKEIGKLVVKHLKRNNWEILPIHDGDLWDVTREANKFKPEVFLSIHANSVADPSAHGIETIALAPGGVGEKIAREIQKELVKATGLADRGVKFKNLHVLRETKGYPAVLVEIGFISNPHEEALMKKDSWDKIVSTAICKGLSGAMGVDYSERGEDDSMLVAVAYWTLRDFSGAEQIAAKLGNCGMFCRNANPALHQDAKAAKHLIVIGGPEVTDHPNVTNKCGIDGPETAILAAEYAKTL